MNWTRWFWRSRDEGVVSGGSFVMDAEWERNEELRPERLGPSQDDVVDPEMYRVSDRPLRTLGPFKLP